VTRLAALVAYLAALLAVDTQAAVPGQLVLGALTWLVLGSVLLRETPLVRAQTLVVVVVATCGEVVGSIVWGVYTYRLENLPSFVPPAHGLVFLAGAALARAASRPLLRRVLVGGALVGVLGWGLAGVTVLPRADVGGALGALLLAVYLLRGRAPAVYAGVFLVVAWLELYGTALGTWTWAMTIPGTGVPNGNPPSGVAAGYVWFDLVALALAPRLVALAQRVRGGGLVPSEPLAPRQLGREREADAALGFGRRDRELPDHPERDDQQLRLVAVGAERDEAEARVGRDRPEPVQAPVGKLGGDARLHPVLLGERLDSAVDAAHELLQRAGHPRCPELRHGGTLGERRRQRSRVQDDERPRRPRQRDVELPQPLRPLRDEGRLEDDNVVELEPLRVARGQHCDVVERRELVSEQHELVRQLVRRDQRHQALSCGEPRDLAVGLRDELLRVNPPHERRVGARAVGERRLEAGRDHVEQRQRELHQLARYPVGVAKLLDGRVLRTRQEPEHLLPAGVGDRPRRLGDVAEQGDCPFTGAARDRAELHGCQVLRLVHDDVPVRARRRADEGVRLVEQRDVAVAPGRPASAEEALLRLVEDPVTRLARKAGSV
jgi:hypothetical protein